MSKVVIQIDGETVGEIENLKKIRLNSSEGLRGIVTFSGNTTLNLVTEVLTDFNRPLELVEQQKREARQAAAPAPVVTEEETKDTDTVDDRPSGENDSNTGLLFPTE